MAQQRRRDLKVSRASALRHFRERVLGESALAQRGVAQAALQAWIGRPRAIPDECGR